MPWKTPQSAKLKLRRKIEYAKAQSKPYPRPCSKGIVCGSVKDNPKTWPTSDRFNQHSHASDGMRPECKECEREVAKTRMAKKKARHHGYTFLAHGGDKHRKTKWMKSSHVRGYFRISKLCFRYWVHCGPFLPIELRFPKARFVKRKNRKSRPLWLRSKVEEFERKLIQWAPRLREIMKPNFSMADYAKAVREKRGQARKSNKFKRGHNEHVRFIRRSKDEMLKVRRGKAVDQKVFQKVEKAG